MTIEGYIRKLARSTYYQNLYISSKEINNIQLFDNTFNFTGLQVLFLYWLRVYGMMFEELLQNKWKYLDEKVINDDIRTDAFLHWRKQQQEKELIEYRREQQVSKLPFKNKENVTTFDIDFSKGGK
jgi:hypothetical protein